MVLTGSGFFASVANKGAIALAAYRFRVYKANGLRVVPLKTNELLADESVTTG